jgi:hypothetical protein
MAIALNLRTGWPIAYVGHLECIYDTDCAPFPEELGWCQCQVDHLGVWTPDGRFCDVNGPATRDPHRGRVVPNQARLQPRAPLAYSRQGGRLPGSPLGPGHGSR